MNPQTHSEPRLVDQLAKDAQALRRLALRLAQDEHDAADLMQELALRTLRPQRAPIRRPGAWLRSVLRNLARDAGRSRQRRTRRETACARDESAPTAADVVQRAEASRRLLQAVLALPEPQRAVVLSRYFDGRSPAQIAEETGVPASTVRSRVHRGLRELRQRLAADDPRGVRCLLPLLVGPMPAAATPAAVSGLGGATMTAFGKKSGWWAACVLLLLATGAGVALWSSDSEETTDPASQPLAVAREDAAAAPTLLTSAQGKEARTDAPSIDDAPDETTTAAAPPEVRTLEAVFVAHTKREPKRRRLLPAPKKDEAKPAKRDPDEIRSGLTMSRNSPLSRWDLIAPFGDVTLAGRVVDENGRAIPHATLMLLPVGLTGEAQRVGRYIFFHRVGKTDARGAFTLRDQPTGRYRLMADFHTAMRDEGDLNVEPSISIAARAGDVLRRLVIQLPLAVDRLGTIRACIVEPSGESVPGETVEVAGHGSAYADRDGCWTFGAVQPGRHTVRTQPYGYTRAEETVDVRAGAQTDVRLVVSRKHEGAHEVRGKVMFRDQSGVKGARVYLGNGDGISYVETTDDTGAFRFKELPDVLETLPFSITVHPRGPHERHTSTRRDDLRLPIGAQSFEVQRRRPVTVHVVDDASGEALAPHAVGGVHVARVAGKEQRTPFASKTLRRPGDALVLYVPAGENILTATAPGRRGVKVRVMVPDEDVPMQVEIRLPQD